MFISKSPETECESRNVPKELQSGGHFTALEGHFERLQRRPDYFKGLQKGREAFGISQLLITLEVSQERLGLLMRSVRRRAAGISR